MTLSTVNPVNRQHPLNRNRLAWWKSLPGGKRTSQFASIISNAPAVFVGTPTWNGWNGVGSWGSLAVSGSNYAKATAAPAISTTQPFTVGGSGTTTSSGTQWIISLKSESGGTAVCIGQRSGSAWKVEGYGSSSAPNLTGTTTPSTRWDRVVYTWDGTNGRLYVNGTEEATNTTAPQNVSGTIDAYLGRVDASYDQWTGSLDDLFYASTAWEPSLVKLDYREWKTQNPTTLRRVGKQLIFLPAAAGTSTYTASAAVTAGAATASGSATRTTPTYTASTAVTTGKATASGSATFTPGTKTATAAVTSGAATASGSAAFAAGTKTASAAATVGKATCSASATFAPGTKTATATVTVGHATASGSATFTAPVYTASATVTTGKATASGTAIFATVVYQGSAAVSAGHATASGSATFTAPVYTGSASVTAGKAIASGSATFGTTSITGSSAVSIAATTASGSATFFTTINTASASVSTGAATASGNGRYIPEFFPTIAKQWHLYLGRASRGQYLNVTLSTPELPDATPTVAFWREGTDSIETMDMPYVKGRTFCLRKMIGTSYDDGNYAAVIVYTINAVDYTAVSYFQVQGGEGYPPIVSVTEIDRSLGRAVVTQDEHGTMMIGYRPRRT